MFSVGPIVCKAQLSGERGYDDQSRTKKKKRKIRPALIHTEISSGEGGEFGSSGLVKSGRRKGKVQGPSGREMPQNKSIAAGTVGTVPRKANRTRSDLSCDGIERRRRREVGCGGVGVGGGGGGFWGVVGGGVGGGGFWGGGGGVGGGGVGGLFLGGLFFGGGGGWVFGVVGGGGGGGGGLGWGGGGLWCWGFFWLGVWGGCVWLVVWGGGGGVFLLFKTPRAGPALRARKQRLSHF